MTDPDPISSVEKKVNLLLAENKISMTKLCESIGMTVNGYSKMWKNRSIKVDTIQKIADYFKVPLSHFFSTLDVTSSESYKLGLENTEVNEFREKYIKALESENELLKKLLEREKTMTTNLNI